LGKAIFFRAITHLLSFFNLDFMKSTFVTIFYNHTFTSDSYEDKGKRIKEKGKGLKRKAKKKREKGNAIMSFEGNGVWFLLAR
jgi:hypothetical protein